MEIRDKLYHYSGAIHIHTTDSDGSKSHEEIIKIAKETSLDFLLFNDHMTLQSKDREGWYGDLLVIIGYEIEDEDNHNHYLAYKLDEILSEEPNLEPAEYVERVSNRGGFGILAHPIEKRNSDQYPPLPWTEWEVDEFDGLELWNHLSNWMEVICSERKFSYLFYPRTFLTRPRERLLEKWDRLNKDGKKIVGVGSLDAHAHRYGTWPLKKKIFPYKVQFKTIRTHILTKEPLSNDFQSARDLLFKALGECHGFISNYRWGDAKKFRFWAEAKEHKAIVGDNLQYEQGIKFHVTSPKNKEIKLFHNGEMVAQNKGKNLSFENYGKGAYRVEVMHNDKKVWILSNHIRLL